MSVKPSQRNDYVILKNALSVACFFFFLCYIGQYRAFSQNKSNLFSSRLHKAHPDEIITAIIHVNGELRSSRRATKAQVLNHFKGQTKSLQQSIHDFIIREKAQGNIRICKQFWIVNALLVEAKAETLRKIEKRNDVKFLQENFTLAIPEVNLQPSRITGESCEWGVKKIQADRVWDQYGYKGAHVTIGHLDTGVDPKHNDLNGKIKLFARFDMLGNKIDSSQPFDSGNHGTHTAGIMVGGNNSGSAIGVAPEAELISAQVMMNGIGTFAQVLAGLEWIIDPDNNPDTDDGADIVNLSIGMNGKNEDFIEPVKHLIDANIFPVFAIGNSGAQSSSSPGNIPDGFAVGAIDEENSVPFFSSGEILDYNVEAYKGRWIKPDITAPGVNVRSSVPGGYAAFSGTSMAAPFVAGSVALLKQAQPNLTVAQIKTVLSITTHDYGDPGKDIRYGWGIIDIYAAVTLALNGDIPDSMPEAITQTPYTYIITPQYSQKIWGDAVTVIAGATAQTSSAIFQYQKKHEVNKPEESAWASIEEDTRAPFSWYWDVTNLEKGTYYMRVLACSSNKLVVNASNIVEVSVQSDNSDISEWGNRNSAHEKTEKVNPAGTSAILVADGTSVILPPLAVKQSTELTIKHIEPKNIMNILPPSESVLKQVGIFREIFLSDETKTFDKNITIYLPYADDNDDGFVDGTSLKTQSLKIFYLKQDAFGKPLEWVPIDTADVNAANPYFSKEYACPKSISVTVDHLTMFAIMAEDDVLNLNNVYIYPNPVKLRDGVHAITFANVTDQARIRIYSVVGNLVREMNNDVSISCQWDLCNNSGENVASGVYYYFVSDNKGNTTKGKCAIIR